MVLAETRRIAQSLLAKLGGEREVDVLEVSNAIIFSTRNLPYETKRSLQRMAPITITLADPNDGLEERS